MIAKRDMLLTKTLRWYLQLLFMNVFKNGLEVLTLALKSVLKKTLICLSVSVLVVLSSCNVVLGNQPKIYEADIIEFYNSNCVLLNKAVEEYKFNTEGKVINIFYSENLILDRFAGLADETSEIVVWEPEAKINHTEHISKYENCVATLTLMNDYMLKYGYEQNNKDYTVNISTMGLNNDFTVGNVDKPYVIEFAFTDIEYDVTYSLIYSETGLTGEFTPIDNNWYVYVWYRV